ncbi:flap endonuclease Xni, partial [Sodalis-like symbiont of Bactericera trigonica]
MSQLILHCTPSHAVAVLPENLQALMLAIRAEFNRQSVTC